MKAFRPPLCAAVFGVLSLVFWYSIIPGIIFGLLNLPERFAKVITLIIPAIITYLIGHTTGSFIYGVEIGFEMGGVWPILEFAIGWFACALLFYAGYHVPSSFIEGKRAAKTIEDA